MRRIAPVVFGALLASPAAWAHEGAAPAAQGASRKLSTQQHAFGREGDPKKATRTVSIDMSDQMRFTPAEVTVAQGETVTFAVANKGELLHEMVIGTQADLAAHAEMMAKHPGMEHDEPWMVHVKAGGRQSFTWQFTRPGTFAFACLVPGHFEAGMKGRINVSPPKQAK